jgi:hypothetical protein
MIAVHFNTALVLLDRITALRAIFGVRLDPQIVHVAVLFPIEPHLHLLAVSRVVLLLRALYAEQLSTAALGILTAEKLRELDIFFAAGARATLDVPVRVGELAAVPLEVLGVVRELLFVD